MSRLMGVVSAQQGYLSRDMPPRELDDSKEQSPRVSLSLPQAHSSSTPEKKEAVTLTDQTNLLPFKQIVVVFLSLSLCIVVSTLDSVIVATAVPTIAAAFDAGSVVSWVPAAFLLTSTSFQPLYGRFSDIFGRKAALAMSMAIFMIGNLISGFSKSILELIIARGIAGAGGGGIIGLCQIVISDVVTLRERGKYQGIIGVVVALGYAIGPIIGGALSEKVSWRWCFWITIPVSLVATCIVVFTLPLKQVEGSMKKKLLVIDYPGTILSLIACALILLPLIWGGVTFPWDSPEVLGTLFGGLFVIGIFCLWEWKGSTLPIVPMYIFKHSTVTGVYITMFVNGFIFFSSIYYIPQYLQAVFGYSPVRAGVLIIPYCVSQIVSSWGSGVLVSRTGKYRMIIHTGFAVGAVSSGLISTVTPESPMAALVIYMLLAGTGGGQTLQTTTVAAQASVPRKDMSVVTAFRNFIRMMGGAFALAVGATIINNTLRASMITLNLPSSVITTIIDDPSKLASPESLGLSQDEVAFILSSGYTHGFKIVNIVNAICGVVATITSILMIKHKELTRGDEDQYRHSEKATDLPRSSKDTAVQEESHCASGSSSDPKKCVV
ncbi:hypothetical protein AMATHDRAFT_78088 [Amanita thiersii Skay4041]|uniref:Major facilitator superfamily (MFS) profile domain-containing protein n=1 Tax=Amanita thiersii Skay4041 TaxID=703135 RepID=A0A2A9N850_9AGAR|nr:hypothetical protein AMATHDRAFT_78088 [Amanita thiersii Skay4041]